jgi:cytochrome P450
MVFANAWTIHRDESEYEKPESFIPERFLDNEFGSCHQDESQDHRRATYSFGAGRRVCPGQHLAENSLVCVHLFE